jgi:dihydroflavonol-4-reductase
MSVLEVAHILRTHLGEAAARVPRSELPDWVVRIGGMFLPVLRGMVPNLGVVRRASNEKARQLLAWSPRSNEEGILATAKSLLQLGVLSQ